MNAQKRDRLKTSAREFPDPPEFPSDLSKSGIDAYRQQQRAWWQKFKALLVALDSELSAK